MSFLNEKNTSLTPGFRVFDRKQLVNFYNLDQKN